MSSLIWWKEKSPKTAFRPRFPASREALVQYVARELSHPSNNRSYIRDYAYTNDREFFAVLAEYFFKSPDS